MAQQFVVLDQSGNPVGVTTCQGATCFPALGDGQSLGGAMAPEQTAPTTTIDPTGVRVNPARPVPPSPSAPVMPDARPARSPSGAPPGPASALPSVQRELAIQGGGGLNAQVFTGSTVPGFGGMAPTPRFSGGGDSGGDPFAAIPNYQDGSRHPAAGGAPRIAGGAFAQQDGGYDNRVQVTNPETGASAGPFGVTAPRSAQADHPGMGTPGGGGGGGGIARDMYWQIRNAVEGKMSGMGPGGSSYGGDTAAYQREQQRYKRQGKRMDRASERYWDAVNNPDPQKAHGWARNALGPNKGNYPLMLARPEMVAEAMGEDTSRPGFDWMEGLPMADLAMITGGTRGRGMTRKIDEVKVPKILKDSIDPVKPDFKREMDYSKYAAELRDLYRGLNGKQQVLDSDMLLGKLAHAKNTGALRQGIEMQADYDPAGAMDRAQGYFNSIFAATKPEHQQAVYADMADNYFDAMSLRGKPQNIDRMVKRVARKFV
jgi:hypothetical protein